MPSLKRAMAAAGVLAACGGLGAGARGERAAAGTYEYEAPLPSFMLTNHGVGPRSTPLLAGDRLFSVGITGTLLCLERDSGRLLWRRDLVSELGGSRNTRGYASRPLALRQCVDLAG